MTAYERMDQLSNNGKSVLTREMLENNGISGNLLSPYAKKRGMERIAPGIYAGDAFVADDLADVPDPRNRLKCRKKF